MTAQRGDVDRPVTDRRTADDATWQAELARLEAAPAADEDTVERVARAMHEVPPRPGGFRRSPWNELAEGRRQAYREMARAAVDALKPGEERQS